MKYHDMLGVLMKEMGQILLNISTRMSKEEMDELNSEVESLRRAMLEETQQYTNMGQWEVISNICFENRSREIGPDVEQHYRKVLELLRHLAWEYCWW